MKAQTKHQTEKARILKAARIGIRLKHTLAADAECAERLPKLSAEIDNALNKGKAYKMNIAALLDA